MDLFTSTWTNKIDKKGRVSVPASYRAAVADEKFAGVILYPALDEPAIDGVRESRLQRLAETLTEKGPFDKAGRRMKREFIGSTMSLQFDGDGRVMLSDALIAHAGLTDTATFIGMGDMFQIWDSKVLEEFNAADDFDVVRESQNLQWWRDGETGSQTSPSPGPGRSGQ